MSEVHTTCKSSSKSESISSASVHQFIPTFEYVFLGLIFLRRWSWWRIATTSWFILRDLADHYKSILRGVARVFKSRRSSSELLVKHQHLSTFTTQSVENTCSNFPLDAGREKRSSARVKALVHSDELGELKSLRVTIQGSRNILDCICNHVKELLFDDITVYL